jgi:hypothetical protein
MKLGIRADLSYRSAGNFSTPTWTEITKFRDVTVNAAWDTVDAPDRGSRVKSMAKTLLDISVSGQMKMADADNTVNAVMDALLSPTSNIDIRVLNGSASTNGARGFRYEAIVTSGTENQGITEAIYADVNFAPDAFSANSFQSVLVTAGSPAFTNL